MHIDSNIVSCQWLQQHLNHPDLVVLDATMRKKPNGDPIPAAEIMIAGAKVFNFDTEICAQETDLPHMMPTADAFQAAVRELGIDQSSKIVIYDAMGIFSSPRGWWMFKAFGHDQVAILDGGLPAWAAQGYAVDTEYSFARRTGDFVARLRPEWLVDWRQVLDASESGQVPIIDARSLGRFAGSEPEPRAGLRGGHIPNALCLPFTDLLNQGVFKSKRELAESFQTIIPSHPDKIIFSCGSGVTASILALAADEVGYRNLAVYDGSWSEWGGRTDLPIATE